MTATAEPLVQPYQYLPQPFDADYDRLKDSIEQAGGLWPGHEIEVDENGTILDGYTRERACRELGLPCPRRVRTDLRSEDEKFDFIVRVNLARRHLTIEQKRNLTREYLRRFPEKSNRAIAATIGLDDKTVAVVRHEAEASAEIPQTVRPHTRLDQERDFDPPEPVYKPDHKGSVVVHIAIEYPMPSEIPRSRVGEEFPKEAERREWARDLVLQAKSPQSAVEFDALCVELVNQLRREIRQDPLLTMLR